MLYNFQELSKIQEELDNRIKEQHKLDKDTFNERLLALLVEFGELANEVRCFKFWSLKDPSPRDVVIEEYVDGIHFLLSLGNDLNQDHIYKVNTKLISNTKEQLTNQFNDTFGELSRLAFHKDVPSHKRAMNKYLSLGHQLGFEYQDIINAYMDKNKKNHERQDNNY